MQRNYHGHTKYCKHGIGSIEEHILTAIDLGYKAVGISEHVPVKDREMLRIDFSDFDFFANKLNCLKEKYKNQIEVHFGLECEYVESYMETILELKAKYNIDYLILGQHYSNYVQDENHYFQITEISQLDEYIDSIIKGLETNQFIFLAHPDIVFNKMECSQFALDKFKRLLDYCQTNRVIIELNCNGLRKKRGYPHPSFWQLVSTYNIDVIISSDSHAPEHLGDEYIDQAKQIAKQLNLSIIEQVIF